ncbi:MAG: asparagine synthase (glutamine-hydrolyzing), partial [Candidatus Eremiobacteraeota bacterium]|nr:asparagine synthase (glutamine-hydrolyzing) [Candidatus Eremiobacteraeota bacterium]
MCGLAGFVGLFDAQLLRAMNACVAHRGPDGSGDLLLRTDAGRGRVGLAHRRLSIIDLSNDGAQPMGVECARCGVRHDTPADDALWLAYNGEIYNFPVLRADLEAAGHQFRSRTDSEVLLHLYAEHGPAMLERLNGIFALALYDGRTSGRPDGVARGDVLLARDGLGTKPLYYAAVAEGVLFGSELKSLLQSPAVSRAVDAAAIHYHLAYLWSPAPHTVLQ